MPGQRIPRPMGRGGMPNRFPLPNQNQESGDEYYSSDGDAPSGPFPGRGRGSRPRGGRGRTLCRHFFTQRGCMHGNNCTFMHPRGPPNGPPA
ncbi:hypothetical protein BCR43DRAFT_451034 [Paramuricea clavata]|nr:hypothetical protein BCR43DRAFT_451034 [Paramuricea clavata]